MSHSRRTARTTGVGTDVWKSSWPSSGAGPGRPPMNQPFALRLPARFRGHRGCGQRHFPSREGGLFTVEQAAWLSPRGGRDEERAFRAVYSTRPLQPRHASMQPTESQAITHYFVSQVVTHSGHVLTLRESGTMSGEGGRQDREDVQPLVGWW